MFYEIVVKLCAERGISIYDLEKQAQIGNGTIGKWRESDIQPSLSTLEKIAKVFEVPLVDLLPRK